MTPEAKANIEKALNGMINEMSVAPHTVRRICQEAYALIAVLEHYEPKTCKCGSAPKAKKKSPTPMDAD